MLKKIVSAIFKTPTGQTVNRKKRSGKKWTYTQDIFTKHIDKNRINTVFEIGAHNCRDTIAINRYYRPRIIYVFECNPDCIQVSKNTLKRYWGRKNICLIEKAVWSESKKIKFYPVVESYRQETPQIKQKNLGASSCFRTLGTHHEKFIQDEIEIDAIRLDDFCRENDINKIDLICMDLEGAEYYALLGLGDMIHRVRYIITEIIIKPVYQGQGFFDSTNQYLENHNFKLIERDMESELLGNFLYVNQSL